ncbi:pyruvate/2-oxoglutarate dehydrogenase complex dihydrolipoamide dehydrogenase (E3) component [Aminicella lysinilytica]|uniref:Pyruvate/2-oxoglutarate dehydrogenase complex dihydrolipoamide dehydrogenase (E3) component n=1 Tax=Aminicella lysinilytica TaxID=433323 RepID=A0A4R6Q298_9FIRM|nr:pyruvate/2-oxoglutarate dehydrogenase complex dihydrolipoamide dehydrogenase (E3) component [Aminicella lysinilytica]
MLRGKNYHKLADLPNVDVIDGKGTFLSPTEVRVDKTAGDSASGASGSDSLVISAEKIFINAGGTPVIPNIAGLAGNPKVFFSETLMDLDELPKRLTIVGGGYIGLEFASMYSSFGSKVTLLQDGARFIPREDEDVAAEIKALLEAQGVTFVFEAKTQELGADGTVKYLLNDELVELPSDAILVATGRKPNTADLGLDAAGVKVTDRGAIIVDDHNATSQPGIWAMGDVTGGLQFTYVSLDDYRVVSADLAGGAYDLKARRNVPYSVFMATPFSRVGINEQEAAKAGLDVRIVKMPTAAVPKARVLRRPQGLLKAIVDKNTDKILGAELLCEESYEMINIVKLAMDLDADYQVLKNQVFTHPTMSESLNDLFSLVK